MRTAALISIVLAAVACSQTVSSAQGTAPAAFGAGIAHVGDKGVTAPTVLKEPKPQYTAEALHAKIQGRVKMECIVNKDGAVAGVRVVQSLDRTFGLDDEAVRKVKEWRFRPGRKGGKAVPVVVTVEMQFNLR